MEHATAAPSVTRVDRWRYKSAVQAAQVLNSVARRGTPDDRRPAPVRPRQSVESTSRSS